MRGPVRETDIAKIVIGWLEQLEWECYQEVQVHSYGHIADIVAVKEPLVWVIECKQSLSLSVIEQADGWRPYAHYLSVCVPPRARGRNVPGRSMAFHLVRLLGIGLLEASEDLYLGKRVHEMERPRRPVSTSPNLSAP